MAANSIERKVQSVVMPLQDFIRDETVSSGFLFLATIAALVVANSPLGHDYEALLHTRMYLGFGEHELTFSPHYLINDALMTLFFMVLGLEIKRELLVGELRDARRAVPVAAAAIGGMLVPAGIFVLFNDGLGTAQGWGIPMATDSAFALGVLMMLGSSLPGGLKAFLVGFAIIDDLGAILVIALFYTADLQPQYLGAAALSFATLALCNLLGFRHIVIYLALGAVLWGCVVLSGVHGTVAGVLIAATVPARPRKGQGWLVERARRLAGQVESLQQERPEDILADADQHVTVDALERVAKAATTPLRRWERGLERPVLILVLPLFAFANAGIPVDLSVIRDALASPLTWGIFFGLVIGKVVGISLLTWLALKAFGGQLPGGTTMRHVIGLALLGGMGFTMSVFIAGLTFSGAELNLAKLAILVASSVAGLSGFLWLRYFAPSGADSE